MDTISMLCGLRNNLVSTEKSRTHANTQASATYSGRYFLKFPKFHSISNNSKRYYIHLTMCVLVTQFYVIIQSFLKSGQI